MTHEELFLKTTPLFLRVLKMRPEFRATYSLAVHYWLASAEMKMSHRLGKQSRYSKFLSTARKSAKGQEKELLKQIVDLGDQFLPLEH